MIKYYDKNRRKRFKKIGKRLIIIVVVFISLFFLLDARVRPIIERTSSYQSKILATKIINQAVYDEVNSEEYNYINLVNVVTNDTGNVTSIESNMININKLKTRIAQLINEQIKDIEQHNLTISLGTISGVQMFYGQGPSIPVLVSPNGFANTKIISKFSEAGINQTLHQIIIDISVDISAIIPGYTTSVTVETSFVVAETVIVGTVPNAYTHVITTTEEMLDNMNNYNAENFIGE